MAIAACYALYFVHLSADFPNGSPWSDWAKYTDEGWYLNAATRHFQLGHWFLPGDFNPAVALPVYPLIAAAVFHLTGVSLVAARGLVVALFGVTLLCTWLLARRHASPAVAMTILSFAVTCPFLFAFARLAIVEPVLLSFFCLALLTADSAHLPSTRAGRAAWLLALAGLAEMMLLTKPTAVFLFPAILALTWFRLAAREFVRAALALVLLTSAGYAAYYAVVVHAGHLPDYQYLFSANAFGHPARLRSWLVDLRFCLKGLYEADPPLAIAGCGVLAVSFLRPLRSLWSNALYVSAVLALGGTLLFVLVRNYQAPHYYLLAVLPMATLTSLGAQAWAGHARARSRELLAGGIPACAAVLIVVAGSATVRWAMHPVYTLASAARGVARLIDENPTGRRLLLSESGDQVSVMAGTPALCDDFGTVPLGQAIAANQPGWFAAWNHVAPAVLAAIHERYHLQRAAAFNVMDDPHRNVFLLYRLVPLSEQETGVVVAAEERPMQHRPLLPADEAGAHATINLH